MADAWSTVVEREPEWDDLTRNRTEALAEHDAACCPGCGLHKSILSDPSNVFTFEEDVCPVCAAQDVYGRVIEDAHEKARKALGDSPDPRTARPGDGHHIYLRPATSAEVAGRRTKTKGAPHG